MVIVGLGLATIAATVFFAWYYLQKWRASWRSGRCESSRVHYYNDQRGRRHPCSAEPLRPTRLALMLRAKLAA